MLFSERIGKKKVKIEIQIKSMDNDLRTGLWNIFSLNFFNNAFSVGMYDEKLSNNKFKQTLQQMWHSYFKWPIDTIPYDGNEVYSKIKKYFFNCEWNEVYDIIEFCLGEYPDTNYIETLNEVLEQELSAYRIIENKFRAIADEEEIKLIENITNNVSKYEGVKLHLETALNLLTDRKNPDYRNSIKESISAVESICCELTNSSGDVLGKTLAILEKQFGLHGALKKGFLSLYGYTSNSDGIRHSLMDIPDLSFADAYFFFIQCSSFTHYLINKFKSN